MQISGQQITGLGVLIERQTALSLAPSRHPASPCGGAPVLAQVSGFTRFAMAMRLSEVTASDQQVSMTYRRDGSLAMRATSSLNLSTRTQEIAIDLTLSAESLAPDLVARMGFAGKPITLQIAYQQSQIAVDHHLQLHEVKPIRPPEEILGDLAQALRDVMRNRGDKSIDVLFDEEAIRSLSADRRMARLTSELVAMIRMLGSLKTTADGARDRYLITVSGKGNPYWEQSEQIEARAEQTTVRVNLTIEPPKASAPNAEDAPDAASAPPQARGDPT